MLQPEDGVGQGRCDDTERWRWMSFHLSSTRCQTSVSSDFCDCGTPALQTGTTLYYRL